MFKYPYPSKPWLLEYILHKKLNEPIIILHTLKTIEGPFCDGIKMMEVGDGELFLKAEFAQEAFRLLDSENEEHWEECLINVKDWEMDLVLNKSKETSEYIIRIIDFIVCGDERGLLAKHSMVSCGSHPLIQENIARLFEENRPKIPPPVPNSDDTLDSVSLSILLEQIKKGNDDSTSSEDSVIWAIPNAGHMSSVSIEKLEKKLTMKNIQDVVVHPTDAEILAKIGDDFQVADNLHEKSSYMDETNIGFNLVGSLTPKHPSSKISPRNSSVVAPDSNERRKPKKLSSLQPVTRDLIKIDSSAQHVSEHSSAVVAPMNIRGDTPSRQASKNPSKRAPCSSDGRKLQKSPREENSEAEEEVRLFRLSRTSLEQADCLPIDECDEENRSGAEKNRSGSETNRSGAEKNRSGAETNRSGSETNRSGVETNRSGAETNRSGAEKNRSGVETNRSGAEKNRSGGEKNRSGDEKNRSGAEKNRSGVETNRSGVETNRSGNATNRSGAETNRSGVEKNRSGVETNRSGNATNRSGAETNRSGAEKNRSGAETNRSGSEKYRFGVETNRSGVETNRSGADTNISGADTNRSGNETNRSGSETNRSGAEKNRSGAEKNRSGNATNRFGVEKRRSGDTSKNSTKSTVADGNLAISTGKNRSGVKKNRSGDEKNGSGDTSKNSTKSTVADGNQVISASNTTSNVSGVNKDSEETSFEIPLSGKVASSANLNKLNSDETDFNSLGSLLNASSESHLPRWHNLNLSSIESEGHSNATNTTQTAKKMKLSHDGKSPTSESEGHSNATNTTQTSKKIKLSHDGKSATIESEGHSNATNTTQTAKKLKLSHDGKSATSEPRHGELSNKPTTKRDKNKSTISDSSKSPVSRSKTFELDDVSCLELAVNKVADVTPQKTTKDTNLVTDSNDLSDIVCETSTPVEPYATCHKLFPKHAACLSLLPSSNQLTAQNNLNGVVLSRETLSTINTYWSLSRDHICQRQYWKK